MASSNGVARLADVARSQLASLRSVLPAPLQSLIPEPTPTGLGRLTSVLPKSLTQHVAPELVVFTFLLPLLVAAALMSWRSYLGERYSPFTTASPHRPPPTVTEDDYQYLDPDDVVDAPRAARNGTAYYGSSNSTAPHHHPHHPQPYHGAASRADADNPDLPDVLILRHRNTTYPLHFRAFAIGEGLLCVGEVRRQAAKATGTPDPRRVTLLYKGQPLRDDAAPCRDEGLKQNSELLCIVSDVAGGPTRSGASSDESADEADMAAVDGELRGAARARRRSERPSETRRPRRDEHSLERDGYLFPKDPRDAEPRRPRESQISTSAPRPSAAGSSSKQPSSPPSPRPSQAPTPAPTASSTAGSAATANANRPKTSLDQLEALAQQLRAQFVPGCEEFARSPPRDAGARRKEHLRLSEGILNNIIFKVDAIEGDESARARRKALVKEAQGWLNRIDEVKGKGD